MRFIVLIQFLIISTLALGKTTDEVQVEPCLYEEVKNNLVSYLIYQNIEIRKSIIGIGILSGMFTSRDSPILKDGRKYVIIFDKVNYNFIDTSFILYSYSWTGAYKDPHQDSIMNIIFKTSGERIFSVGIKGYYRRHFKHQLIENGIVALKSCDEILFCNGGFESNIEYLYFKDGFEEDKFLEYIKVRCYNMKPTDIQIDLKSRTATFFSESLKCKFKLSIIDTDDEYYKYFYKIEEIE